MREIVVYYIMIIKIMGLLQNYLVMVVRGFAACLSW